MRRVQCHECGKRYDYDQDGFCPNCGAFNQPQRASRISADGSVVREDGLNEQNHAGSFVHRELHAEDQQRRRTGLEKAGQRIQQAASDTLRAPLASQNRQQRRQASKNPLGIIVWIIFAIIAVNILGSFLTLFF